MDPLILFTTLAIVVLLLLLIPMKGASRYFYRPPVKKFHEADSVLSRRLLLPGSESYETYYASHPAYRQPDDRARNSPGLLAPGSRYYHAPVFSAASANFRLIESLAPYTHEGPDGIPKKASPPSPGNPSFPDNSIAAITPSGASRFLLHWLNQNGAHSAGIARLEAYHLYSHKGRGPRSGQPIANNHPYAIALTVEMDHRMLSYAPAGPAVLESSEQYLRSGILALKLAVLIREMGYGATAHIDGNYEVICPLVAVDAGLGTIGRMGLLMTPKLGPRVRIAVVTTDIPLIPNNTLPDRTVLHFCDHCRKCTDNCPAGAIPSGPRIHEDGTERWRIQSERCYQYWTLAGTDCGRCMAVCPFSHRDTRLHRFVRWGIKNNLLFRHLAIKLDDVLYGRRPKVRPLPGWADMMDKR